jgi:ATP-binding protein involved in chromosome partitioning
MAVKVLQEFVSNVQWGPLDYLLIDMPPGTGDVQLSIAQTLQLTGAIVVTTPQQVAMGISGKGIQMFQQVKVPILGVIENMSEFVCGHCNQVTEIFRSGGGRRLAERFSVPVLGHIPLTPELVACSDEGQPMQDRHSDHFLSTRFAEIAEATNEVVKALESENPVPDQYQVTEDGGLKIHWPDGHESVYNAFTLRVNCHCASCVDEVTRKRLLDPKSVSLGIRLEDAIPVGRYALALVFSDGHQTGLYTFDRLRKLCECDHCKADRGQQPSFQV